MGDVHELCEKSRKKMNAKALSPNKIEASLATSTLQPSLATSSTPIQLLSRTNQFLSFLSVAKFYRLALLNMENVIHNDSLLQQMQEESDGHHWNDLGHELIAKTVTDFFTSVLNDLLEHGDCHHNRSALKSYRIRVTPMGFSVLPSSTTKNQSPFLKEGEESDRNDDFSLRLKFVDAASFHLLRAPVGWKFVLNRGYAAFHVNATLWFSIEATSYLELLFWKSNQGFGNCSCWNAATGTSVVLSGWQTTFTTVHSVPILSSDSQMAGADMKKRKSFAVRCMLVELPSKRHMYGFYFAIQGVFHD